LCRKHIYQTCENSPEKKKSLLGGQWAVVRDKRERSSSSPSSLRQLEKERWCEEHVPNCFLFVSFSLFLEENDDYEDDDGVAVKRKV
jgi:hypothetical protein